MPVAWELHDDVLVVTLVGKFEGYDLIRAVEAGLAHASGRTGIALLLDARASRRAPIPEGLRNRAAQLAALRPSLASRAAIVTAPTSHRRFLASLFARFMALHGMELRVFEEKDAAAAWLRGRSAA